ncbi:MAG: ATP-binding protein [Burkholderiaceae bacterium]
MIISTARAMPLGTTLARMETDSPPITPVLPELAGCADEPIRVPGAVQPHGWLLVLSDSGKLVACSENWPGELDPAAIVAPLNEALSGLVAGDAPAPVGMALIGETRCDVSAHRSGKQTIVEFEPAALDDGTHAPIYTLARHFLPQLQKAQDLQGLLMLTAREMKALTGFGRCLIYRFDTHGHGEVLAEVADAGYDSYAQHHFPASDIPQQARDLYQLNHFRIIPDANYTPVGLRCLEPGLDPRSLDLSFAALRSVSPIHLEFMRNMRTMASMSVSIVVGGKLWGLISCHDHQPKRLYYPTRVACEHLGRLLSLQVEAKEDNAEVAKRLELRRLTLEIVSHLADSDATLQRLVDEPRPLLALARASGAAVVLDGVCWTVGETPSSDCVLQLADWVAGKETPVFHTDSLAAAFPGLDQQVAAGVLAISISQVHRHLILWFRPEIVRTIQWAGQPGKEAQGTDGRVHPRRSFTSWREQVQERSAPWSPEEEGAAFELRQALMGIVLRRAQEMAEMATELGRANKELEAFSYTVSHDLRAPMRHIAGYIDLVLEAEAGRLDQRSLRYLAHVKEASVFAGQLVDALLDFSRMGRSELKRKEVDSEALVEGLVRELSRQDAGRAVAWDVRSPLPLLNADAFLLQVAVRNLLSNAVKYSRGSKEPRIAVLPIRRTEGDGLEITDNGVGFQMQYAGKLFEVFQRLHKAEEFEGTGIGLASVRRIVERHGGRVWARGAPGEGATFGFTLPRKEAS